MVFQLHRLVGRETNTDHHQQTRAVIEYAARIHIAVDEIEP